MDLFVNIYFKFYPVNLKTRLNNEVEFSEKQRDHFI